MRNHVIISMFPIFFKYASRMRFAQIACQLTIGCLFFFNVAEASSTSLRHFSKEDASMGNCNNNNEDILFNQIKCVNQINSKLVALTAREKQFSQIISTSIIEAFSVKNSIVNMPAFLDRYRKFFKDSHL